MYRKRIKIQAYNFRDSNNIFNNKLKRQKEMYENEISKLKEVLKKENWGFLRRLIFLFTGNK